MLMHGARDGHLQHPCCLQAMPDVLHAPYEHPHQAVLRAQVWDVPAAWSLRDAATVPVAYLTAYYSLVMRGGLVRAHRVLVHSGTGAVGLAAIRIALHRGCEVWRPSTKPYVPRTASSWPECRLLHATASVHYAPAAGTVTPAQRACFWATCALRCAGVCHLRLGAQAALPAGHVPGAAS